MSDVAIVNWRPGGIGRRELGVNFPTDHKGPGPKSPNGLSFLYRAFQSNVVAKGTAIHGGDNFCPQA